MKFLSVVVSLLFVANVSFGQSFFKPLPKVAHPSNTFGARALVATPTDSTLNAWRPTATAAYAEPGNIAMAGVGLAFQHLKWDVTNMRWQSQWSIGAYGFAGGSVAPQTPSDIISLGVLFGFYNDLIRLGPIYNTNGKFGAAISIGVNFNN